MTPVQVLRMLGQRIMMNVVHGLPFVFEVAIECPHTRENQRITFRLANL